MRFILEVWRYVWYNSYTDDVHFTVRRSSTRVCSLAMVEQGLSQWEVENRRYVFSHWLRPCSAINRKRTHYDVAIPSQKCCTTWPLSWPLSVELLTSLFISSHDHADVIKFRDTGHLCGEFTGPRWIPHTKTSDAELWCFLWSAPE